MSGTLKESNPWAPDLDVTVPLEDGTTIDVKPQSFVDSNEPGVVVTHQPVNGTITSGDAPGLLVANLSQEGQDEARYTLTDTRGFVSAPAVLRLTGVSQQPEPDPPPPSGTLSYSNPFNATSAYHRPIGTGATYASPSTEPANADASAAARAAWGTHLLRTYRQRVFINSTLPFAAYVGVIDQSNPLRVVTWNGKHGGLNLPTDGQDGRPGPIRITPGFPPGWDPIYRTESRDSNCIFFDPATNLMYELFQYEPDVVAAAAMRVVNIAQRGHGSSIGQRIGMSATGVSIWTFCLRVHEIETPGMPMRHPLSFACPIRNQDIFDNNTFLGYRLQLPACTTDGAARSLSANNGPLNYGELVAIPPQNKGGPNLNGLGLTELGRRLGECLRDYGAIIVDGSGAISMRADGPSSKISEARDQLRILFNHVSVVTNSVSGATAQVVRTSPPTPTLQYTGSVGTLTWPAGGGTPLVSGWTNPAYDA